MFTDHLSKTGNRRFADRARRIGGGRVLTGLSATAVFLAVMDLQRPAHAYLDPGTGSIILQMLLGGFAGALFVLKLYWARFAGFFRRDRKRPETTPARTRE